MGNITYTRYASRTGEILDILSLPDDMYSYDRHSTLLYEGEADGTTHYFLNGVATSRPCQESVIDTDTISVTEQTAATLSDLPDPCAIAIDGPTGHHDVSVTGGSLSFTASFRGDYVLTVTAFPYLNSTFTVHAI